MGCPKKDYPEKVIGIIKTESGLYKIATYTINKEKRARFIEQSEPDVLGLTLERANRILSGISSDFLERSTIEELGSKCDIKVQRWSQNNEQTT